MQLCRNLWARSALNGFKRLWRGWTDWSIMEEMLRWKRWKTFSIPRSLPLSRTVWLSCIFWRTLWRMWCNTETLVRSFAIDCAIVRNQATSEIQKKWQIIQTLYPMPCSDTPTSLDSSSTTPTLRLERWTWPLLTPPSFPHLKKICVNGKEILIGGITLPSRLWQSCTEFGYWQIAPKRDSTRSRFITTQWHLTNICSAYFNLSLNSLPPASLSTDPTPHTSNFSPIFETNENFGARSILASTSRILFVNGREDPWSVLGVESTLVSPNRDHLRRHRPSSYLIPGVGHCADLGVETSKDPIELTLVRQWNRDEISRWLRV